VKSKEKYKWKTSNARNPTSNVKINKNVIRAASNHPNATVKIQENKAVNRGL
jgi:hypothetical protein